MLLVLFFAVRLAICLYVPFVALLLVLWVLELLTKWMQRPNIRQTRPPHSPTPSSPTPPFSNLLQVLLGCFRSMFTLFWAYVGPSWDYVGTRTRLGFVELSWAYAGFCWVVFGPSWDYVASPGLLRAYVHFILGLCWTILGLCWDYVGFCWVVLGLCWPILGLCWAFLVFILGHLGPVLAYLGAMLRRLGTM